MRRPAPVLNAAIPPKLSVNADITARQPSVESRCGAVAVDLLPDFPPVIG